MLKMLLLLLLLFRRYLKINVIYSLYKTYRYYTRSEFIQFENKMDKTELLEKIKKLAAEKNESALIIEKSEVPYASDKAGSLLGKGGFGTVYLCNYNGEQVVLKKISLINAGDEDLKMIVDECVSLKKAYTITQKIPKFYGIYKGKTKLGLIMQFIKGKSLLSLYSSISDRQKTQCLIGVTEILHQIHQHKMIHRDLKPDNIMVNLDNPDSPDSYIIDFGLCKIAKNTKTRTAHAKGTPQYKCPEVFDGDDDLLAAGNGEDEEKTIQITIKVDVWALGVMISEVFSGVIPWSQRSTNWLHVETMLMSKEKFPIPENIKNSKIVALIEKCVNLDPAERPTDEEIIAELKNILKDC